jgi:hypothetical protein
MVFDVANQRWVNTNESGEEDMMAGFSDSDSSNSSDNDNADDNYANDNADGDVPTGASRGMGLSATTTTAGPQLITLDMLNKTSSSADADLLATTGPGSTINSEQQQQQGNDSLEIGDDWDVGWGSDEDEDPSQHSVDGDEFGFDSDGGDGVESVERGPCAAGVGHHGDRRAMLMMSASDGNLERATTNMSEQSHHGNDDDEPTGATDE